MGVPLTPLFDGEGIGVTLSPGYSFPQASVHQRGRHGGSDGSATGGYVDSGDGIANGLPTVSSSFAVVQLPPPAASSSSSSSLIVRHTGPSRRLLDRPCTAEHP